MEEALEKIRPHVKSTLMNQSGPAKLLVAVETTLKEEEQEATPVAYYASFLATLQESVKREGSSSAGLNLEDGSVVPSTLYLLSIVLPHVPHAVVRSNMSSLLNTVAPLFSLISSSAPPLRSTVGIVTAIIEALDAPHLTSSSPLPRQSFATILELTVDPRPKVRKRAQEAVVRIINSPPPPMLVHPYSGQTADFIIGVLNTVAGNPGQQETTDIGIWLCTFTKTIAPSWPSTHLDALLQPLLSLPSLSSPYLTSQTYAVLSALLRAPTLVLPAQSILSTLLDYSPSHNTLAVPWLDAVENAMVAFARADAVACSKALPGVWEASWTWLESDDIGCRKAAESGLCAMVRYCLTDADVQKAVDAVSSTGTKSKGKKDGKTPINDRLKGAVVESIILRLDKSLHSVTFAKATPALLSILSALISRLRLFTSPAGRETTTTAAEILAPDLIVYVGSLRLAKGFEYREKADEVLGVAVRVLGPEVFLGFLPLNITPESPEKPPPAPGRAFLLPLLARNITNTSLKHFTSYFVPLSERLFEFKVNAAEGGKENEAKVWEILIEQVWGCFKGYCEACVDLREAFTIPFARLITNLLYTQPNLRTSIVQGLRILLQTNLTLSQSSAPSESLEVGFGISQDQAKENIEFLKSVSGNMISVLFNVFSSVPSEDRGLVGEVVKIWMAVLPQKEVKNVHGKITGMLSDALSKPVPNPAPNLPPVSHTMLDLLLFLLPFLPPAPTSQLFDQALIQWIEISDVGVQKRSYRLLARCIESEAVVKGEMNKSQMVEKVIKRITETTDKVVQGAQKDRIELLTVVVPALSASSQLHHIPSVLPEAILATKEVNEKARTAAFDLLVVMGRKMTEGGVVKRNLIDGIAAMDLDGGAKEVNASVEEYMTMVAAGLVGSTPHMISASITAISRLLFEFRDSLPETMRSELVSTIIVFLTSNNREIVKSALGFVKLSVITLPISIVRPHFPQLVPALLGWSHDHKNHFKIKVQHIFERMGRRFGWESVMQYAGDEDDEGRKVLENVKKRKEKAKKQKAKAAAREEEAEISGSEDGAAPKANAGNAFEDVLYGSDSDSEEGHGDNEAPRAAAKQKGSGGNGRAIAGGQKAARRGDKNSAANRSEARIRADDDAPMDLLHAGAANAVASNANRRRQPGQDASHFKTDSSTGRIIIDDETFKSAPKSKDPSDDIAGQAYREQMAGVDGFTRGPGGEVKFHKNTKKRRAEETAAEAVYGDVEMGDGTKKTTDGGGKKKKIERVYLGQEFKAKNAGGDVIRKGQQDPYAYLPLSSIGGGKKKGGAGKVKYNITGKR